MIEFTSKHWKLILELLVFTVVIACTAVISYKAGDKRWFSGVNSKTYSQISIAINERSEIVILEKDNGYKPLIILSDSVAFGIFNSMSGKYNKSMPASERK